MSNSKGTVMILGAGRGQVGLYRAAKKLGYKTVAISIEGDYPGFDYADECEYLDLRDVDVIVSYAKEIKPAACVTACLEMGLPALGAVCDACSLPGLSHRAAILSTNKFLMKDALIAGGVSTPGFRRISSVTELEEAASELRYPLMIKAVDQCSSKGITKAESADELPGAFENSMSATSLDYCIVEEFVTGYGVGITAFVADGRVVFILPTGDVRRGIVPIGHYLPYEDDSELIDAIKHEIEKSIRALGLDNCAINADIMIQDGVPYVLEITGRLGANALPELTSVYLGTDIYELIVETAAGNFEAARSIDLSNRACEAARSEIIISDTSGVIESIEVTDPNEKHISEIWVFAKAGDSVSAFSSLDDSLGQIVVYGSSQEECEQYIKLAKENVTISIV